MCVSVFEQGLSVVSNANKDANINISSWILNDYSGLVILSATLIVALSLITIIMLSLLCANAAEPSRGDSGNSDIYSNGYEKVKKGLCRRLKVQALSACISKKRSKCKSEIPRTGGCKTATAAYVNRSTSVLQVAIVDHSVAPFTVDNSLSPNSDSSLVAPLGTNKRMNKLSPAKFVGRGATVAPGLLLHCGRSGNASSEHLYSDAFYNEIADHDTELEETAVCNDKRCHQDTTAPKQEGAQNGAMKSTTVMRLRHLQPHVYDTPDFEKKFSTTNSRDGYSQLAMYRLEGTQYGDDDLFAYWDAGDPVSHNVPGTGTRSAFRTQTENSYYYYTSPYTVRTNQQGSDEYYESGGDGSYSKQNAVAANHVYSGIDREARGNFATMRTLSSPNVDSRKAIAGECSATKLTRRPSTSSDRSCPVISTDRPVSSNALPRSSQLVYEDMVQPVEARLNYCEPPLPRFVSEGTSCSSGGNTCQAMASLNVANYSSRNSPNPSQCHGSPCSSGDANSTRESVTFSVERVDTTMSDAPEVSADREEVQVVEPADNSDMSNHYEYAEPGDAAAWYYHHNRSSNDENENERRGLRPSETESLYTEGSAFRYHVITMRPRLGSDGGQNLARQQDYQGRFGPYSCVHLYINEEAIRAQEDNHAYNAVVSFHPRSQQNMRNGNNISANVYDLPPFEAPRSMPHLHLATTAPVSNAPSTNSATPNDAMCHFCYLKSFPSQSRQCLSSSVLGNGVCVCSYNNDNLNNLQSNNNCPSPSSTDKSSKAKSNTTGGNTIMKFFSHFRKNAKNSRQNEQQKKSPRIPSSLLLSADCIRNSRTSHVSVSGLTNTEQFSHALSPDSLTVCNGGGSHMPFLSSPPITPPRFANSWVGSTNGAGLINASSPEHNMTSKNCCRWSQNEPQSSHSNEIRNRTANNNNEFDVMDSDHYYSEVQYYQNAYDDATLTRNVYLPSTLPPIAAQSRNAVANYQSTSLHQRPQNPSIHRRIYSEPSNSNAFYNHTNDPQSSTVDLSPVSTLNRTYEHPGLAETAEENERLKPPTELFIQSCCDSVATLEPTNDDEQCSVHNVPFIHAKSKGAADTCMAHCPPCEAIQSVKQQQGCMQNHIYQEIPEAGLSFDGASENSRDCCSMEFNPYSQSLTPDNTTFEGGTTLMGSTRTGGDIFLAGAQLIHSRSIEKTMTNSSNDYDTLEHTDSELL